MERSYSRPLGGQGVKCHAYPFRAILAGTEYSFHPDRQQPVFYNPLRALSPTLREESSLLETGHSQAPHPGSVCLTVLLTRRARNTTPGLHTVLLETPWQGLQMALGESSTLSSLGLVAKRQRWVRELGQCLRAPCGFPRCTPSSWSWCHLSP